jgi:hypothetical protein
MKNLLIFASILLVSGLFMWSCQKEAQLTPTIATVENTDSNIEFVNGVTDNVYY